MENLTVAAEFFGKTSVLALGGLALGKGIGPTLMAVLSCTSLLGLVEFDSAGPAEFFFASLFSSGLLVLADRHDKGTRGY